MGLEDHEDVHRVIDGEKHKFLLEVLFEEKIISRAEPSEAEIKDWYTRQGEEIRASHILVDSEATALKVLQELKDGAIFEELALEYSVDPSVKRNQGDLGWFIWGTMVDNFQEAAYNMKPGEISAPVKSEFGYHIIKVVDRRKVERHPTYDEAKPQIRTMIVERRKRSLMQDYADKLHDKYPVTVEEPTCDFVLNKLEFLYPPMMGNQPRWRNNIDPSQLDPDEHALVLGRFDGGQLTLGDYLNRLRRIPEERRPDFDQYDSLAELIFQMSFLDILVLEAEEAGLENNEMYKRNLNRFKELAMADILLNDSIPKDLDISEEDIEQYYDENPSDFTTPVSYHLYEIQLSDREKAERYAQSIKSEAEFKRIAARETLRPGLKNNSGDLGIVYPGQYPDLYDAAVNLTSGNIAGPIRILEKYSIIWVKEKHEPVLQSLENSRGRIIEILTRDKMAELYNGWLADIRKRVPIEISDEVLTNSVDYDKYAEMEAAPTEP
jgi:parvulin-like peptidyl-prolyl isomerase